MKKLSIDTLNAYPTVSQEELMEIKGGTWYIGIMKALGLEVATAVTVSALASAWKSLFGEDPAKKQGPIRPEDLEKLVKLKGYFHADSIKVQGSDWSMYGVTYNAKGGSTCNCGK